MTEMKWLLLVVAFLALAATLLPIRSTPPMLLSNADAVEWKCSKSALILTTCAPNREVRFTSVDWHHQAAPPDPKSANNGRQLSGYARPPSRLRPAAGAPGYNRTAQIAGESYHWWCFHTAWVKTGSHGPKTALPLYPRERTLPDRATMSEKCQQPTSGSAVGSLFSTG